MPKAPSTTTNRPALRRNQACRSCRKRKLKCDAARPHCGTCVKQWQAAISVPAPVGYAHPTEPPCSYDPVEGLTLAPEVDPLEKIRQLEAQVSELKDKLNQQQQLGRASTSSPLSSSSPTMYSSRSKNSQSPTIVLPSVVSIDDSSLTVAGPSSIKVPSTPMALMNLLSPESPETLQRRKMEFNQVRNISLKSKGSHRYMELLFSGWNADLPEPSVLNHYIDVFFRCDPCGSRVLHRPSFLSAMLLSPKDPDFPHAAILHAICACASRWSPRNMTTLPDGSRRDSFAEFHAGKTRQYIDRTMASGDDIFQVMQACALLSWYFYHEGRWVEVWIFAGFQTRVAIPLRLNHPGTYAVHDTSPGSYLAPPKDLRELERRRRTWWMAIIFDRIASVGGWIHGVDERDLGTELPLTNADFEKELPIPSNPQDITTPDLFTMHPPEYTDSFLLLIKAIMLFGRVTDHNVRRTLRATAAPSKSQNPFFQEGFEVLDTLVCSAFLEQLPSSFKTNSGVTDAPEGSTLDTDLYMVHVIPHAATITLHNSYIDFSDPQCVSTARCVNAARCILAAYYTLSSTSLDITRLHPFITICWYLAAAVQVQLCKYFIEIGDSERESAVWGEINVLRFAMLEFGNRSPIGIRQERLLQGLMREIVRLTAQKQPLEVGVSLYPFSRTTLFRKDETRALDQEDGDEASPGGGGDTITGAPFPSSPSQGLPFGAAVVPSGGHSGVPKPGGSPTSAMIAQQQQQQQHLHSTYAHQQQHSAHPGHVVYAGSAGYTNASSAMDLSAMSYDPASSHPLPHQQHQHQHQHPQVMHSHGHGQHHHHSGSSYDSMMTDSMMADSMMADSMPCPSPQLQVQVPQAQAAQAALAPTVQQQTSHGTFRPATWGR